MEIQNIKTFIFDLGNVIIDLDTDASTAAFAALLGFSAAEVASFVENQPFMQQYEMGLISDGEFRDEIRKIAKKPIEDFIIDDAWNAMLGAIPKARLEVLHTLRQTSKVYILSNTNSIHERRFHQILADISGHSHLSYIADKVYFSHEMNLRKPDMEIYQRVIDENNLNPQETLFLDDKLENLKGAAQCGLQTYHVTSPDLILSLV